MSKTHTDFTGEGHIDSRDLIEARDGLLADAEAGEELDEDMREFIEAVNQLADKGIVDWEFGAQFIREDTFEDYARDLAENIGAVPSDLDWPLYCIDWERAARELRMDYSSVTFMGYDYYVRS